MVLLSFLCQLVVLVYHFSSSPPTCTSPPQALPYCPPWTYILSQWWVSRAILWRVLYIIVQFYLFHFLSSLSPCLSWHPVLTASLSSPPPSLVILLPHPLYLSISPAHQFSHPEVFLSVVLKRRRVWHTPVQSLHHVHTSSVECLHISRHMPSCTDCIPGVPHTLRHVNTSP